MNALSTAEKLFAEGKIADAITALEADIACEETPEKLTRLMQFRHSGFFRREPAAARSSWPPAPVDLGWPLGEIPQIPARQLDARMLEQGVMRHGSLIVRNLLGHEDTQALIEAVDQAMAAYDHGESCQWYTPLRPCAENGEVRVARKWVREGGGVLAADSPKAMELLISTLKRERILPVIEAYLGEPPALSLKKTTLRRVSPASKSGWHQDGAFLGNGIRTLNLWIALSDCGIDAPSMDMIPARLDRIIPTGENDADFNWSVGHEFIAAGSAGVAPVRLKFSAGDAIFFDEMNLHRTAVDDGMTRDRYAIEAWFFAPSSYPLGQIPVLC